MNINSYTTNFHNKSALISGNVFDNENSSLKARCLQKLVLLPEKMQLQKSEDKRGCQFHRCLKFSTDKIVKANRLKRFFNSIRVFFSTSWSL